MTDSIEGTSQKIHNLQTNLQSPKNELRLPKHRWQPFFVKVLSDFIDFHNLPKDLPMPEGALRLEVCMSRVLDIMLHSMGNEKREKILKELELYKEGLPFDLR
jgi:hypothetical protein